MGDSSSAPQALVTQAITKIQKLASLISDFKDDDGISQQTLNSTFNEYISLLGNLEKASHHPQLTYPPIPVALLQTVDGGGHPDEWLKCRLIELEEENARVRGKTRAISTFRMQLQQALGIPDGTVQGSSTNRDAEVENDDSIIDVA